MVQSKTLAESGYGYPQPSFSVNPAPIEALRDPTTSDIGFSIGQRWINTQTSTSWELVTNAAGVATWLSIGGTTTPAVATLTSAGNITSTAGNITATAGNVVVTAGNLVLGTAGDKILIKAGANGIMGTSTLVAGSKSIAIASVDANTRVFLSRSDLNASPAIGFLVSDTSVGGTLTVKSLDATGTPVATDVSKFNYICFEAN